MDREVHARFRSPVPLKCIVIRLPSDSISPPETDPDDTDVSVLDVDLPEIEQLPDIDNALEEP